MAGRFQVNTAFTATDKVLKHLKSMRRGVLGFTRAAERGLRSTNRILDKTTRKMQNIGTKGALAGAAVGAGLTSAGIAGASFEQTIVNAAAKFGVLNRETGEGAKTFKLLSDAAKQVGATTEFTATQAADALKFMGFAGISAEQAVLQLAQASDFAAAAEMDLARATDVATDVMGIFGKNVGTATERAANFTQVTDLLANASINANFSVEQMFESLQQGGPIAKAAGVSMEDTATILGVLANAGIKASEGGTGLKRVLLGLTAPTAGAMKAMRKLGVQVNTIENGALKLRKPLEIFKDLQDALRGKGGSAQTAILDAIFGKIGIASSINLIDNAGASITGLQRKMSDYENASAKLAKFQRDTAFGDFKKLTSAIDGVKIAMFEMNKGPLRDSIQGMTKWIEANKPLIIEKTGKAVKFVADNFGIGRGFSDGR